MNSEDETDIQLKLERFFDQSQLYLKRLLVIKRELDGTDRFDQSNLYIEKLSDCDETVANLTEDLRSIERLYLQLSDNQRTKLDQQIQTLRDEIDRGISELHRLREEVTPEENAPSIDEPNTVEVEETSNVLRQRHVSTNPLNHTYDLLERDLAFLRDRVDEVAIMVAEQEQKLSRLEYYRTIVHNRIHSVSSFLHNAIRNPYVTTASGAVVGASVGGPVGFVMGAKIGSLVALSGSALGALSMNIMRQKVTETNDSENDNNNTMAYSQAML